MEEMQRAGYGERSWSFHALSEGTTVPKFPCVYQPGRSPNPILLGLCGGFITLT